MVGVQVNKGYRLASRWLLSIFPKKKKLQCNYHVERTDRNG